MEPAARQGLILGAVVGVFVAIGMIVAFENWFYLLFIPFCAIMGLAPQLLKPKDEDED